MSWQKVKLKEVINQIKDSVLIDNSKDYKLVTVSNKGVIKLREIVKGVEISANKAFVAKKGQFIYSRLSIHNGAFGIIPSELNGALVTSEMPLFEFKDIIIPDFFIYSLKNNLFKFQLEQLTKGVGRTRVKESSFLDLEIDLPSIEIQNLIVSKIKSHGNEGENISNELTHQLDLIKQLRQAFLREAMQGKLVRTSELGVGSETGHELLARIKAEKTKLIKEKKLKAGLASSQTISLINNIKIPSHWVWCKADEIFFITKLAGFEYSKHIKLSEHGEIPVVRAQNVRALNIDKKNLLYIDRQTSELLERCALTKKSLLVTFIGAGIGDVATFEENERWHLAPNVAKMEPFIGCENLLSVKFINYFMMSDIGQKEIFKHVKATAQPSLSMGTIRDIDIPLPPLHEQEQIVAKLEELMAFCDGLEQSIKESQGYNEKLLQQVLREALQPE